MRRMPCHEAFLNETLLPDVFVDPRSERHRSFDRLTKHRDHSIGRRGSTACLKAEATETLVCWFLVFEKPEIPNRTRTNEWLRSSSWHVCSESKTGLSADPSMARAEGRPLDPSRPSKAHESLSWDSKRGTDAPRPRRRAQTTSAHRVSTRIPPPAPHAPLVFRSIVLGSVFFSAMGATLFLHKRRTKIHPPEAEKPKATRDRRSGGDSRGNGTSSRQRGRSIALLRFRGGASVILSIFPVRRRCGAMTARVRCMGKERKEV